MAPSTTPKAGAGGTKGAAEERDAKCLVYLRLREEALIGPIEKLSESLSGKKLEKPAIILEDGVPEGLPPSMLAGYKPSTKELMCYPNMRNLYAKADGGDPEASRDIDRAIAHELAHQMLEQSFPAMGKDIRMPELESSQLEEAASEAVAIYAMRTLDGFKADTLSVATGLFRRLSENGFRQAERVLDLMEKNVEDATKGGKDPKALAAAMGRLSSLFDAAQAQVDRYGYPPFFLAIAISQSKSPEFGEALKQIFTGSDASTSPGGYFHEDGDRKIRMARGLHMLETHDRLQSRNTRADADLLTVQAEIMVMAGEMEALSSDAEELLKVVEKRARNG